MNEAATSRATITPVDNKNKLGMWFFLGGEVILFGTLIATYVVFRTLFADQYAAFKTHLSLPLAGAITFLLVTSSFFVARGLRAASQGQTTNFVWSLVIALALGAAFIGGQAYEWSQMFTEGVSLAQTFGSPFFVVTGIHGVHVLVGLAWGSVLAFYHLGQTKPKPQSGELFGLYWHFVDIIWIILFSLIYLI